MVKSYEVSKRPDNVVAVAKKLREAGELQETAISMATLAMVNPTSNATKVMGMLGPIGKLVGAGIDLVVSTALVGKAVYDAYRSPGEKSLSNIADSFKQIPFKMKSGVALNVGLIALTAVGLATGTAPLMFAIVAGLGALTTMANRLMAKRSKSCQAREIAEKEQNIEALKTQIGRELNMNKDDLTDNVLRAHMSDPMVDEQIALQIKDLFEHKNELAELEAKNEQLNEEIKDYNVELGCGAAVVSGAGLFSAGAMSSTVAAIVIPGIALSLPMVGLAIAGGAMLFGLGKFIYNRIKGKSNKGDDFLDQEAEAEPKADQSEQLDQALESRAEERAELSEEADIFKTCPEYQGPEPEGDSESEEAEDVEGEGESEPPPHP